MDVVEKCKKIAIDIFNDLGSGFEECVYKRAFGVDLMLGNMWFESEKGVQVVYKSLYVGDGKIDFFVDNKLVVEVKAIASLGPKEEAQLNKYMRLTNINKGLLINFTQPSITYGVSDSPEFIELPNKGGKG